MEMVDETIDEKDIPKKYFRHDPYYTPNNYDVYFDVKLIPSNIRLENGYNLERRLNKLMPLTRKVHLNFDTKTIPADNNVRVFTSMKINGKGVRFLWTNSE